MEGGGGDVEAHINKLVRVGLLERSSSESVRFVAKYMVTIIYDMILHSKRVDMHKVNHCGCVSYFSAAQVSVRALITGA